MRDLTMVVATHKPYWMPEDEVYLPLQVGAAGCESVGPYARDDTGINISSRNASFCELTGLYWAWKNLGSEYVGLVHYRRHFVGRCALDKKGRVATGEFLSAMLDGCSVILPAERNYFIETTYSQYAHAHHGQDLAALREVLRHQCPEYLRAFDESMHRTHGHRFNMFVMQRDVLDAYCEWLFAVLFEGERRISTSGYSPRDARVFGYLAERLLDPWIDTRGIRYRSLPVVNLERQCWPRKCRRFIERKYRGELYEVRKARDCHLAEAWRLIQQGFE